MLNNVWLSQDMSFRKPRGNSTISNSNYDLEQEDAVVVVVLSGLALVQVLALPPCDTKTK